jgi:FO synthase
VPHRSSAADDPATIADTVTRRYRVTGIDAPGVPSPMPRWATAVSIADMTDLIAYARQRRPGVGIQIRPNLADWWPELVAAGATDLGGLSPNGDHISPTHPVPSPARVRKRLASRASP